MTPDLEDARAREVAALDAEILEAIGRGRDDPLGEDEFDRLARDVFAHQFRFNPVYRQFCLLQGASAPADVEDWRAIPQVPTGAFKVGRWATFPPEADRAAFRTSGTTGTDRGVHFFDTLGLYNAAIVASARRYLVPDRERIRCLFLSPPPGSARESSLVHMFAVYAEAFGEPGSVFALGGRSGAMAPATMLDAAVAVGEPVLVAGAALAYLGVLESTDRSRQLPDGSRCLVTGGFKGAARRADPEALASSIEERLGIPRSYQVQEYGMTELSSQLYDGVLRQALGFLDEPAADVLRVPPWMRVRVVEPFSGRDVEPGETGALVHVDLANRGSALVVQTSDLGAKVDGGVRLAGREPGAEARGCSLAAELWLGQ